MLVFHHPPQPAKASSCWVLGMVAGLFFVGRPLCSPANTKPDRIDILISPAVRPDSTIRELPRSPAASKKKRSVLDKPLWESSTQLFLTGRRRMVTSGRPSFVHKHGLLAWVSNPRSECRGYRNGVSPLLSIRDVRGSLSFSALLWGLLARD